MIIKTKKLKPTDPMPFGKYKGCPLGLVPDKYFNWLWKYHLRHEWPEDPLAFYVGENVDYIEETTYVRTKTKDTDNVFFGHIDNPYYSGVWED